MREEIRHCLRNLVELCNLDSEVPDLTEALLDRVMDGTLQLSYYNGEIYFQSLATTVIKDE